MFPRSYGSNNLTEGEQRVIEFVNAGLKNGDIAKNLGITKHTVKNRLRVIYEKLGLWNRVELALWYEYRKTDSSGVPCVNS